MKTISILTTLLISVTLMNAQPAPDEFGCISEIQSLTTGTDTVNFKTAKIWKIGEQEWSDVVTASRCKKTTFLGKSSGHFNADCRQNPGYGDLFSWCAIKRFGEQLCPAPWRVPTREDFIILGKFLGSNGDNDALLNKYIKSWGGVYGGFCNPDGTQKHRGSAAYYWSQTEEDAGSGYSLDISSNGGVGPHYGNYKHFGFAFRCVR